MKTPEKHEQMLFKHDEAPRLRAIAALLLDWYDQNARVLPWRENTEAYRVWVSEIMLQQTQVETVIPYYKRFLREAPDVKALAKLPEERLLKLWEGLGYYSRARNLQKAAKIIAEKQDGRFPEAFDDILALPGIGRYTAGAIASICFDLPTPAVDGNVLRVIARLTGLYADISLPEVKQQVSKLLSDIYPDARRGDFTQSLMELGATLCLPKAQPECSVCPLKALCRAYAANAQAALPVKAKKAPRRKEKLTVFLLTDGDFLAVRKRGEQALLKGLWEFPNVPGHLNEAQALQQLDAWGIVVLDAAKGAEKKHIFTHVEWDMKSYLVACGNRPDGFVWTTKPALGQELALPSAFRPFYDALF